MREISAKDITTQVKRLCMEANSYLPEDIKEKINACERLSHGIWQRTSWASFMKTT